jgi:hypothetical protein
LFIIMHVLLQDAARIAAANAPTHVTTTLYDDGMLPGARGATNPLASLLAYNAAAGDSSSSGSDSDSDSSDGGDSSGSAAGSDDEAAVLPSSGRRTRRGWRPHINGHEAGTHSPQHGPGAAITGAGGKLGVDASGGGSGSTSGNNDGDDEALAGFFDSIQQELHQASLSNGGANSVAGEARIARPWQCCIGSRSI